MALGDECDLTNAEAQAFREFAAHTCTPTPQATVPPTHPTSHRAEGCANLSMFSSFRSTPPQPHITPTPPNPTHPTPRHPDTPTPSHPTSHLPSINVHYIFIFRFIYTYIHTHTCMHPCERVYTHRACSEPIHTNEHAWMLTIRPVQMRTHMRTGTHSKSTNTNACTRCEPTKTLLDISFPHLSEADMRPKGCIKSQAAARPEHKFSLPGMQ